MQKVERHSLLVYFIYTHKVGSTHMGVGIYARNNGSFPVSVQIYHIFNISTISF